ncbi:hypothetical protein [Peribacillus sp. NJ11]|uniref:hypothetical protein n=1 Tax=Peribacillus sp. NJ11 TaxID=3055861 RepID=UPI00338E15A0
MINQIPYVINLSIKNYVRMAAKLIPKPISDDPEMIEIAIKLFSFKNLRNPFVNASTKKSQQVRPRKIIPRGDNTFHANYT